jgi:hypothetical protein
MVLLYFSKNFFFSDDEELNNKLKKNVKVIRNFERIVVVICINTFQDLVLLQIDDTLCTNWSNWYSTSKSVGAVVSLM